MEVTVKFSQSSMEVLRLLYHKLYADMIDSWMPENIPNLLQSVIALAIGVKEGPAAVDRDWSWETPEELEVSFFARGGARIAPRVLLPVEVRKT